METLKTPSRYEDLSPQSLIENKSWI